MARILVTDGQERSALAVVRSLGRAGHEVHVCSAEPRPLAGASRHTTSALRVPDRTSVPDEFRTAVAGIAGRLGIEFLIPVSDAATELLRGLDDEVPGLRIPIAPKEAYDAVSDKHRITALAAEVGLEVPRQIVFDDPVALAGASAGDGTGDLRVPVILKPSRSSVRTPSGMRKAEVRLALAADQVTEIAAEIPVEAFPVLAQEQIRGPGLGVFLLLWEGELLASFAHRRLREKPPTGGVSVYRESIPLPDELLSKSRALLERVGWQGVAMVEYKLDAASGRTCLMEVNGRFWGSLQLAIDAGVDFPALLVAAAAGTPRPSSGPHRSGVRSRWLWGDFDHLHTSLRLSPARRAAHPELPGKLGTLARFLVPWRPGDRFEVLRMSDPHPFLRETANWFRALSG